jgi:hypothetical protein
LSKVSIPLLKTPVMKASQETDADFEARVAKATNRLVGNYGVMDHWACQDQIRNGRLNRVFKVASVKYLPRPEPATGGSKKQKVVAAFEAKTIQVKTKGVKWRRPSTRAGDKTSDMELVLVKLLDASRKLQS